MAQNKNHAYKPGQALRKRKILSERHGRQIRAREKMQKNALRKEFLKKRKEAFEGISGISPNAPNSEIAEKARQLEKYSKDQKNLAQNARQIGEARDAKEHSERAETFEEQAKRLREYLDFEKNSNRLPREGEKNKGIMARKIVMTKRKIEEVKELKPIVRGALEGNIIPVISKKTLREFHGKIERNEPISDTEIQYVTGILKLYDYIE